MNPQLSVFIITRNEEERLGRTIEAIRGIADQIVVVDSGSTDGTVAIAESLGASVHHREWTGYGPQKRFAEDQCKHDWLLNIDADEVVTPGLVAEITALFEAEDSDQRPRAYRTKIHNIYPGDKKPRLFANDYNVVRLYHRSVGRYRDHPVFDRVELAPGTSVGQLKNPIHHHSIVDWEQMVDKANRISSHQIARVARKSVLELKLRIFIEFPLTFIRNYFFGRHIFGGWKGFIFALNTAFLRTLRIAKALEYRQANKR